MARKSYRNDDQLPLFNAGQYERQITEASIDCAGYEPKSSPVERFLVERENFLDDRLRVGDTFIFKTDQCDRLSQIVLMSLAGQQATIVDLNPSMHPGKVECRFSGGRSLWLRPDELPMHGYQKSSPVPREIVQRENFQWVEKYLVKRRYLYWRYCYLKTIDAIEQVVKVHIPGAGRSVREGRMHLVREAIALGKSPQEIEQLIKGWSK